MRLRVLQHYFLFILNPWLVKFEAITHPMRRSFLCSIISSLDNLSALRLWISWFPFHGILQLLEMQRVALCQVLYSPSQESEIQERTTWIICYLRILQKSSIAHEVFVMIILPHFSQKGQFSLFHYLHLLIHCICFLQRDENHIFISEMFSITIRISSKSSLSCPASKAYFHLWVPSRNLKRT